MNRLNLSQPGADCTPFWFGLVWFLTGDPVRSGPQRLGPNAVARPGCGVLSCVRLGPCMPYSKLAPMYHTRKLKAPPPSPTPCPVAAPLLVCPVYCAWVRCPRTRPRGRRGIHANDPPQCTGSVVSLLGPGPMPACTWGSTVCRTSLCVHCILAHPPCPQFLFCPSHSSRIRIARLALLPPPPPAANNSAPLPLAPTSRHSARPCFR